MKFSNSRQVIQLWLDAVNQRKTEEVLALYSPEALLLPTFSPHTLSTSEKRGVYFNQLASRPGMEVSLHEKTLKTQIIAPGVEMLTGIYRFQFAIDDEPLVFEARFSYLIDLNQEAPILHHHSSQIPRTLS